MIFRFFFTCFNHKKTPQNFSLKNNYYSLGLLKWYFLHFNVSFWHLVGYISAKRDSGMNAKLEDLIIGQEILIFQPFFNSVPSYHYAIISAISQRRNHQLATIGFANLGIKNDFSKLLSIFCMQSEIDCVGEKKIVLLIIIAMFTLLHIIIIDQF